eukprot:15430659-Alexandrium_andersonii.AAC.1
MSRAPSTMYCDRRMPAPQTGSHEQDALRPPNAPSRAERHAQWPRNTQTRKTCGCYCAFETHSNIATYSLT